MCDFYNCYFFFLFFLGCCVPIYVDTWFEKKSRQVSIPTIGIQGIIFRVYLGR